MTRRGRRVSERERAEIAVRQQDRAGREYAEYPHRRIHLADRLRAVHGTVLWCGGPATGQFVGHDHVRHGPVGPAVLVGRGCERRREFVGPDQ